MTSLPSSSTAPPVPETRSLLLEKIDAVLLRLLKSAQFRTHKYFRVSVPHAITGQALVQQIHEAFLCGAPTSSLASTTTKKRRKSETAIATAAAAAAEISPSSGQSAQNATSSSTTAAAVQQQLQMTSEESGEALHFATMLMQFGYIFPVIDVHAQAVKEDGTLYRIQLPYFWPSNAQQADNAEYAIYLSKRLMRNEQKHGLDEEEVDDYNRLVELLGHMWPFITAQAELQLKAQKERKKADKVVFDSEERAFWRLRKPGHVYPALEESAQKLDRRIRKCTAYYLRVKVERMRQALRTKPWLKVIKASEAMTNWTEQLSEYDPFLAPPQTSNPWISEDVAFWTLNADIVDVPTEKRVKRWGLNVVELVRDPLGRKVLESFLDSEFSAENIRFWTSIQELRHTSNSEVEAKAQYIYDEFLAVGAPCQVNIDSRTLEETLRCLKEDSLLSRRFAFSLSEEHVFTLMGKDSYPRFLRSPAYNVVLENARAKGKRSIFDLLRDLSGVGGGGGGGGGGDKKQKQTAADKKHHHHHHHKMSRSSACPEVGTGGGMGGMMLGVAAAAAEEEE